MTPERERHAITQCGGKFKFLTFDAANRQAKRARRRGKKHEPLQAYRCNVCRSYHIGNRPG